MSEQIPPSSEALKEALELSSEILADIELNRISLTSTALKTSRLARLLNDFDAQVAFRYEASGYPSDADGVTPEVWNVANKTGRVYHQRDSKSGEMKPYAYLESIEELEMQVGSAKIALQSAIDRDVSLSSANPYQHVTPPIGNTYERVNLRHQINDATKRLSRSRGLIHDYAQQRHYELKFSGIAYDAFSKVRERVDRGIGKVVPQAVQKFNAVYDNLKSDNPEDWSNAVHSCRRILQDLADAVFPPQDEPRIKEDGSEIMLGSNQYINRLMCFVEDRSTSSRFSQIVGSHLRFLGERLDAVFKAAQKGSHSQVSREEADRYLVYTYMLVGDILSLSES